MEAHRDYASGFTATALEALNNAGKLLARLECRFYFPRALRDAPTLTKDHNLKYYTFMPKRNDKRLNPYDVTMHAGWRTNCDIQPCTVLFAVKTYITKYASKVEVKSEAVEEIVKECLPYVNSGNPLLSLQIRMINKLIGERDWSQHEVLHHLLGLHLKECSRAIIPVDMRPEDQQSQRFEGKGANVAEESNILQKYKARENHIHTNNTTYFQWLTLYNWKYSTVRPRASPRILDYFPKYKSDTDDFARVKLSLHPFRDVTELLTVVGNVYQTHLQAFEACQLYHNHDDYDYYGVVTLPAEDHEEFEDQEHA